MEEQSIFNTELSDLSKNHILSAAKWSRFLGIVGLILVVIVLFISASMLISWEEIIDSLSTVASSNPALEQLEQIESLPKSLFLVAVLLIIAIIVFMAILYLRVGRNGVSYYSSNEESAFLSTFRSAKTLFMVYAIFTVIGIAVSIIQLFALL